MRFLIIHLARARAREANVEALRASLPGEVELIDAIDGQTLGAEALAAPVGRHLARPHYPFTLSPREIACFLSHRKAWERIAAGEAKGAMVLEDDVVIEPEAFGRAVQLIERHAVADSYIRLPVKDRETNAATRVQERDVALFRPEVVGLGMQAQFIGKAAAAKLLRETAKFDRPVDTLLQMPWATGVEALAIRPNGVREISGQIGGSTISGARKPLLDRLAHEIGRPIYRALHARRARLHAPIT